MKNTLNIIGLMIVLVFLPALSFAGDSWRCGNRLVSEGFLMREVTDLCGPPSFVDAFQEEISLKIFREIPDRKEDGETDDGQHKRKRPSDSDENRELLREEIRTLDVEEWTYNKGSSSFMRFLRFEDGRLVSIKEGSYGFDAVGKGTPDKGDSRAEVWMKYGPTDDVHKSVSYDVRVSREKRGDRLYVRKHSVPVTEETWVYDRGPDKYLQELIFVNDTLRDIKTLKTKGRPKN